MGDEGSSFIDLFEEEVNPFSPDVKIVLPTAKKRPVTINAGMLSNSWYDILSFGNDSKQDES